MREWLKGRRTREAGFSCGECEKAEVVCACIYTSKREREAVKADKGGKEEERAVGKGKDSKASDRRQRHVGGSRCLPC